MKERLGKQAKDLVTGIEGIITAYTEHLNGCVRYCVQPPVEAPGKPADKVEWVDAQELQITGPGLHDNRTWYERRYAPAGGVREGQAIGGPAKADAPKAMGRE